MAEGILAALDQVSVYPFRHQYHAWPGPNSNTFVRWVLETADLVIDFDPRAIGKDYFARWSSGVSVGRFGFQWETPCLGLKFGPMIEIEIHIICLTFGLCIWPLRLKSPIGSFGESLKR
ncbi:MAG: DUF3750 domain-containing protein [Candidatus Marinimicrobia bacterium]|nr:DUF3750 domain-containing protein [Candidatus Neomarinimicrobiota bacterium]